MESDLVNCAPNALLSVHASLHHQLGCKHQLRRRDRLNFQAQHFLDRVNILERLRKTNIYMQALTAHSRQDLFLKGGVQIRELLLEHLRTRI